MAGCGCASRRSVVIETTVLRVEGDTCVRCSATVDNARVAARELAAQLEPLGIQVILVEHATTREDLADSNAVVINGRPIEAWLGARRVETECVSCADLCGEDSVCCGAMVCDGELHESYSVEHIREAVMRAVGVVLSGGGCC